MEQSEEVGSGLSLEVATDVGGTFTDIVCYQRNGDTASLTFGKVHSTPPEFDRGVFEALTKLGIDYTHLSLFIHGSTVVINALTERRGVPVGFITTRGFRDILMIGRANRPDLYNIQYLKPAAFVERRFCAEITERLDFTGTPVTPPNLGELAAIIEMFREGGIKAVGLCLLHSYANPAHEAAIAEAIRAAWPEVSLIASHEICREWREYERGSTTVLSAYVKPRVADYLHRLEHGLVSNGFGGRAYLMQSNGGLARFDTGRENPITLVESGPAAGMFGAMAWGRMTGQPNLLALDIGGTTAKCTLIENGHVNLVTDYRIERTRVSPGHPIRTPVVDIVEIGTGGGSIASVDAGGRLQVGPRSAGAEPGPIAYGKGGREPTTTDANLWTGRIARNRFAGGADEPDLEPLARAFAAMGSILGVERDEAARGILRVANANMVNALKLVSINRGRDPQDIPLIAFGGGGPLHAAFLAAELRMRTVIIPPHPAVFSAWGMLLSDARRDYFRTFVATLEGGTLLQLASLFEALVAEATSDLASEGRQGAPLLLERSMEMRYLGQEHSLRVGCEDVNLHAVDMVALLTDRFHAAHEQEFTFRLDASISIVGLHLAASVPSDRPPLSLDLRQPGSAPIVSENRLVDFDIYGSHVADIYSRDVMSVGTEVAGPALIEEENTATVLPPGFRAIVDEHGNIVIRCPAGDDA